MKKQILLMCFIALYAIQSKAQVTYPNAFSLASGTYTFNNWPATSIAATYPSNLEFYRFNTQSDPLITDTIFQVYTDVYNATSATRINGLGQGGFSFINTGNAVNKLGAAILELDATGRQNLQVSWTGKTITPNFREYEVRLYYRVGNSGTWIPVLNTNNDTVRYVRSANAGDSINLGPITLPAAVNNQSLVQIQWKYFQTATNTATGARAELGINNIIVSSSPIPIGTPTIVVTPATISSFITTVNSTSISDSFSVSGSNLTSNITLSTPNSFEVSNSLTGSYSASITLTPVSGTLANSQVYVRFHPTVAGAASGNVTLSATGAITQNVSVSGNTPAPTIIASSSSISNTFYSLVNTVSTSDSFSVSGNFLINDITLTAPIAYEIATSLFGNYSASLTLHQNSGLVSNSEIYVRFHPLISGVDNDTIKITSTNATTQSILVYGNTINSTNPTPCVLANGNYSLTQWDSSNAAGNYPANMIFHTNSNSQNLTNNPLANNWTCPYNLTSLSRIKGLAADGFSFVNTSSPQYDNCASGSSTMNAYMGAALLALNTIGTNNITLGYNVGLVAQSDGTIPRVYNIRLQYRMDTVSQFVDYMPVSEYTSAAKVNGDVQNFTLSLPSLFSNQPYVEFRWIYYADATVVGSGTRPELRIDEINVSAPTDVQNLTINFNQIIAYPNPIKAGETIHFSEKISGAVYDVFGRKIKTIEAPNATMVAPNVSGIYYLRNCNLGIIKIVVE